MVPYLVWAWHQWWQCKHKAVPIQGGAYTRPIQGGAHKRRSVATAGVLSFKGGAGASARIEQSEPCVERSKPEHGVVCWSTGLAVHTQCGAQTRRCTHKAVCGHHSGG